MRMAGYRGDFPAGERASQSGKGCKRGKREPVRFGIRETGLFLHPSGEIGQGDPPSLHRIGGDPAGKGNGLEADPENDVQIA